MLDPRTKLLLALAYGTLIALTRKPEWLLAEWALLVAAIVVMNRWKAYLRWLAMLLPMALFFGGVTWWSTDRATGQAAATSLMAITTTFFVFFASTEPEDLGNSLVHAGLPFPVAFVMTAAMLAAKLLTTTCTGAGLESIALTMRYPSMTEPPGQSSMTMKIGYSFDWLLKKWMRSVT